MRKVLAITGAAVWSASATSACHAATPGAVFAQAIPIGRYWVDAVIVGVLFGAALVAICMSSRRL